MSWCSRDDERRVEYRIFEAILINNNNLINKIKTGKSNQNAV